MKAIADYFNSHKVKYNEMHEKREGERRRSNPATNYRPLPDYSPPVNKEKNEDDTISNSDTAVPSETTGYYASFSLSSDSIKSPEPSKWGRLTLPVPQFSRNDFSVWSILKQCIGKELSKITMPIVFNEPISFLQRIAENMEYSHLLEKANNCDNPVERMEYVSAFAVASVSSNWERLGKPFNPLLGETYELVREEENFKFVAEQVSHHPPVTAFYVDSPHFIFTGAIHPKLKLWARSVEVKPEGTMILKLLKHNETYTWTGVTCCVHNIIVGKLWMEQCGVLELICQTNGLVAELNFKPAGWYSKDLNCVEGFILDRQKTRHRFLFGKWCSFIKSIDADYHEEYLRLKDLQNGVDRSTPSSKESSGFFSKVQKKKNSLVALENNDKTGNYKTLDDLPTTLLWEADPRPEWSSEYYNFTFYAMALNECTDDLKTKLLPTDSRLRPDIRKLEEGDIDGAAFHKNRLEEKQREVRKQRRKDKTTWTPVWFESKPHPFAKEEFWSFKGDYWERNFSKSPDIF